MSGVEFLEPMERLAVSLRDDMEAARAGEAYERAVKESALAELERLRDLERAARAAVAAILRMTGGKRGNFWLQDYTHDLIAAVDALEAVPVESHHHSGDRQPSPPDG